MNGLRGLLLSLLLMPVTLGAQVDSVPPITDAFPDTIPVYTLPAMSIRWGVLNESIPKVWLDTRNMLSMAEILRGSSPAFVREYGPGNLSVLTFRGGSSSQTQINWHGIPIQSGAFGMQDMALLPGALLEGAHMESDAAAGSAPPTPGGSLDLYTIPEYHSGDKYRLQFSSSAGSWGMQQQQVRMVHQLPKWRWYLNGFYGSGLMDYPYADRSAPGHPTAWRTGTDWKQGGMVLGWQTGEWPGKGRWDGQIWLQRSARGLASVISAPPAGERQWDQQMRFVQSYCFLDRKVKGILRAYGLMDSLRYVNPASLLTSRSVSRTWGLDNIWYLLNHDLRKGANVQSFAYLKGRLETAQTENYAEMALRPRYAVQSKTALWRYNQDSAGVDEANLLLSQEIVDGKLAPFSASGSVRFKPVYSRLLQTGAAASRTYRYPSLNDLYWVPGGNPALLPEKAVQGELSLYLKRPQKYDVRFSWSTHLSAWARDTRNWILWQPSDTAAWWSPVNLPQVRSRGMDLHAEVQFWHQEQVRAEILADYALAQSAATDGPYAGMQLIYTPVHQVKTLTVLHLHRSLRLNYAQQWVSRRYIYADHTGALPAYSLGDAGCTWILHPKQFGAEVQFLLRNVWNVQWESMPWRPMPGRSFLLTLSFHYPEKS